MPDQTPKWDVLALGEVKACFEERADGLYARDLGGDALCVAAAVARMGGQAALAGRLGGDALAQDVQAVCDGIGVDTGPMRWDATGANGHEIIPKDGVRTVVRGGMAAARLRAGDLAASDVAAARVLHLSGVTLGQSAGAAMAATIAVEQAHAADVLVSFDPVFETSLWAEEEAISPLLAMIGKAHVVFPTIADAALLFGSDDPETVLTRILAHGPQVVMLSTPEGAWVATNAGRSFAPKPSDTGPYALATRETLIGTFLSGLTAGDDLAATAERAVQAAHLASHVAGAVSSIPALEDLLSYPVTAICPSAAREQPMNAGPYPVPSS